MNPVALVPLFKGNHQLDGLVPLLILWMDEILHHLRNPGMICFPCKYPQNSSFPWLQRGAGFRPSTVSLVPCISRTRASSFPSKGCMLNWYYECESETLDVPEKGWCVLSGVFCPNQGASCLKVGPHKQTKLVLLPFT